MRFISKVFICFPLIAFGLPELKTKQAIQNIRYISQDGLVTYYQKSSGHLQFATNYNFQTVMKLEKNTEYKLVVSEAVGKVAIEVDKTFFQTNNLKKDNDIFLAVYKSSEKPKKVGAGTAPRFHLSTGWLSYFKSTEKSIYLINGSTQKKIKILNPINSYFVPQVHMITPNDVIYTDINQEGYEAVIMYSLADKKFEVLYKAIAPGIKLELCVNKEELIVGSFPYDLFVKSSIQKVKLFGGKKISEAWKVIYESDLPDIGNLVCHADRGFFVKTKSFVPQLNLKKTEIAQIDLKREKKGDAKVLTDLQTVSQVFLLGDMIIASNRGKYYMLEGKSALTSDEIK